MTKDNSSITDASKLEDALTSNFNEMKTLLSSVMTGMMNKIGRFTGTNSYVTNAIKSATTQTDYLTTQIKSWEERLERREQTLYDTVRRSPNAADHGDLQDATIAGRLQLIEHFWLRPGSAITLQKASLRSA